MSNNAAPSQPIQGHRILIDRGHRGRLRLRGRDHKDLLHRLTTNEVRALAAGQGRPNLFLNNKGRMIELFDQLVFEDHTLLALASDEGARIAEWIQRFLFAEDVSCEDVTAETGELLIAGPGSAALLGQAGIDPLPSGERNHRRGRIEGIDVVVGVAEALAGGAFRLIARAREAEGLRSALLERDIGLRPVGTEIEEVLRIAAGYPAADREVSERFNPLEIGLVDCISFTKGCYTGQEVIARLHNYDKVQRQLRGVLLDGGEPPAADAEVRIDETPCGRVTSSVHSPRLEAPIALALIEKEHAEPGAAVSVAGRRGTLVNLPFPRTKLAAASDA